MTVLAAVGASAVKSSELVQTLWSGYGEIVRLTLVDGKYPSVIVKWINPPSEQNHPHGWNTNISHQRKLQSYQVEAAWYQHFEPLCNAHARVPACLYVGELNGSQIIVMEDLDAAGFNLRKEDVNEQDVKSCLTWLANFHAWGLGVEPAELWPTGTYWHLATRPDELAAMQDVELKQAAKPIDETLSTCQFQTLVHGDAKLANFCFAKTDEVAAVDFQYVGGGCGMKDVTYFLGSCLDEQQLFAQQDELLGFYFSVLKQKVSLIHPVINVDAVEQEWREMYPLAWADFTRFLTGWMPDHWKLNTYSEYMVSQALAEL